MREIKFRAWDKKRKKWAGNIEDYMFSETLLDCPTEPVVNVINILLNDKEDNLVWLQFTGFKDKNGKEIYEGDIVDTYPDEGGYPTPSGRGSVGEVVFHIGEIDFSDGDCVTNYCGFVSSWDYLAITSNCEVIGNIYENPELLKK